MTIYRYQQLSAELIKLAKKQDIDLRVLRGKWLQMGNKLRDIPRFDRTGHRVEMKLTYEEWASIWLKSGKFHLRGNHLGSYHLGRANDLGDYEVGNCRVVSMDRNLLTQNRVTSTYRPKLTPQEVQLIRSAKNIRTAISMLPQVAGKTVVRVWRNETYLKKPKAPKAPKA